MKRILDGMKRTMMAVNPPRYTALEGLQKAETANPFKILIGTVLSARTKDENTTKAVTGLFKVYNTPQKLAKAKVKDVEKIIKSVGFYHVKSRRIIEVANIILFVAVAANLHRNWKLSKKLGIRQSSIKNGTKSPTFKGTSKIKQDC